MDDFLQIRKQLIGARQERDALDEQLHVTRARLHEVENRLAGLRRAGRDNPNDPEGARLLGLEKTLQGEMARLQNTLARHNQLVERVSGSFVSLAPPQQLVEQLDDAIPFLLFPMRMETKFMRSAAGGNELWVRLYPDDIAIETHEKPLTEDETAAGKAYWEAVWRAGGDQALEKGAWRALAGGYGAPRAAWISKILTPTNLDQKPNEPLPPEVPLDPPPQFPEPDPNQNSWTRAPRTRVMPDRFVVATFVGNAKTHEVVGNAIPDTLIVGPDPLQIEEGFQQVGGELRVDPAMEWLGDFHKAVELGMAVRIPITPQEAAQGFDRVLALGLRLASDETDGQQRLENLFDSHHYTEGWSLIPQGTPTNNTEESGAGFSSFELGEETSFRVERGEPLFEPVADDFAKSDGQRLAEALGIASEALQHVQHSDRNDIHEAMAMNCALWPATLGYFMEEMMRPVFSLEAIRKTRFFFTRYVSGRGYLPAIRIGVQPYGILPTSVFSRWKWPPSRDNYLADLYNVLRRLDQTWSALSQQVTHAGSGNDPEKELLDLLGLHPSSVEYYQRVAVGPEYFWNFTAFGGRAKAAPVWHSFLLEAIAELLSELGYNFSETPKIFNLSFFRHQTKLTGPLIDDAPLSEEKGIKPITPEIGNYIHWLLHSDINAIREQNFGMDENGQKRQPPTALLYLMLRHALMLDYWDAAMKLHVREKIVPVEARREVELMNMREQPDVTRWDYFEIKVPPVTGNLTMGEFLRTEAIAQLSEAEELQELKTALSVLADLPTARMERLLAEHLDLCSYRLDAWQLAMINLRLQLQRQPSTSTLPSKRFGIYLGAFGWLEDLRPAPLRQVVPKEEIPEGFDDPKAPLTYAPNNAGYIHAPSLNHAGTAAILRNAYITHADSANAEMMSVNLSSARVRRALWYLEGIRNGQELGALLGYQFERGLHDRNSELLLDKYILPIRKKFPLVADQITESNDGDPIEALEARNVVNGLKLIQAARDTGYPYDVIELPAAGSTEGLAIQNEVSRIADSLDAISDLALAESVYQVTQGNFDRAGAMLKAISEGGRPTEPEVARTPRSGTALTHRVTVNFGANAPDTNPWPAVALTPRAVMEKWLNHWLGTMLGDPANIRCQARFTITDTERIVEVSLQDLAVQPLDFIYLSGHDLHGEDSELEKRISYHVRKRENLSQETPLDLRFIERQDDWEPAIKTFFEILPLANNLREIVTGCRAVGADDFILPSDKIEDTGNRKRYNVAELRTRVEDAREALSNGRDTLEAAKTATQTAGEPFPPNVLSDLRHALLDAANLGMPDAIPAFAVETTVAARDALVAQAEPVLLEMHKRLQQANAALAPSPEEPPPPDAQAENLMRTARLIFGRSFKIMPFFALQNTAEAKLAIDNSKVILTDAPPLAVDEWLQGLTKVRPKLATYQAATMLADTLEHTNIELTATQLPFKKNDRWLALPLAPNQEINGDKLSLIMQLHAGYDANLEQSGLLIDEWVEVIPNRTETTGVAFHFDQPNAEPAQALLLAVTPEVTGKWNWQDLIDTLHETLDMAKKRAVEPDQLGKTAYAQLLPTIMSAFTMHLATFSLDYAVNVKAP